MIASASSWHVSKNELTPGGIVAAISAISSSGIGPGPLGIADTSPTADAPCSMASHASSTLGMQQIFIRGFVINGDHLRGVPQHGEEVARGAGDHEQVPD